jgi:hypothetical protein
MTTEIIFTIAAVITALGVIFGGVYATFRIVHRIGQALGVDNQGRTISDRLDRVEHQLWENGGSSLADRVNRIETHVARAAAETELIKDIILAKNGLNLGNLPMTEEPLPVRRKPRKKPE